MTSPEVLTAWLKHVVYKPGWVISVFSDGSLRIDADTIDVNPPHGAVTLSAVTQRPYNFANRDHFLAWLYQEILRMEMHEAGEWFEVDGARPYDPHRAQC